MARQDKSQDKSNYRHLRNIITGGAFGTILDSVHKKQDLKKIKDLTDKAENRINSLNIHPDPSAKTVTGIGKKVDAIRKELADDIGKVHNKRRLTSLGYGLGMAGLGYGSDYLRNLAHERGSTKVANLIKLANARATKSVDQDNSNAQANKDRIGNKILKYVALPFGALAGAHTYGKGREAVKDLVNKKEEYIRDMQQRRKAHEHEKSLHNAVLTIPEPHQYNSKGNDGLDWALKGKTDAEIRNIYNEALGITEEQRLSDIAKHHEVRNKSVQRLAELEKAGIPEVSEHATKAYDAAAKRAKASNYRNTALAGLATAGLSYAALKALADRKINQHYEGKK